VARSLRAAAALAATLAAVIAGVLAAGGCREDRAAVARALTGGDPDRGRLAIRHHGCGSCHAIPGVGGAASTVGPSLDAIGRRSYLAGRLPNTVDNLIRWIRDPQGVVPGNAMPQMAISEPDGRDIAAYLYTLQ
jgi:cytochrome c